jgi:hypothetical protein
MVFTLTGASGQPADRSRSPRPAARATPPEIDEAEQALRAEIMRVSGNHAPAGTRARRRPEDLRKRTVRPLVQQALATVRSTVPEQPEVLQTWLQQVERELLQHLHWFELAEPPKDSPGDTSTDKSSNPASTPSDDEDDGDAHDALNRPAAPVPGEPGGGQQHGQTGAPVIVEDNPQLRTCLATSNRTAMATRPTPTSPASARAACCGAWRLLAAAPARPGQRRRPVGAPAPLFALQPPAH